MIELSGNPKSLLQKVISKKIKYVLKSFIKTDYRKIYFENISSFIKDIKEVYNENVTGDSQQNIDNEILYKILELGLSFLRKPNKMFFGKPIWFNFEKKIEIKQVYFACMLCIELLENNAINIVNIKGKVQEKINEIKHNGKYNFEFGYGMNWLIEKKLMR